MTTILIVVSLVLTTLLVWLAYRYLRNSRVATDQLSGPVLRIQEELLLTADSAVDRLDSKMAQIEILLEEMDRRGRVISQQIERQQALQSQTELQRKQLGEWLQQERLRLDESFETQRQLLEGILQQQATAPKVVSLPPISAAAPIASPGPRKNAAARKKEEEAPIDKRSLILKLAEEGMPEMEIARKIGVGKGEVTLLLKLRKKTIGS